MSADADRVLETLLLPFTNGALDWPAHGGALFLHARDGWPLHRQPLPGLVCATPFKPDVDALQRTGLAMSGDEATRYPLVLLLPPRQREYARALLAHAVARTTPGGIVIAAVANTEGAKSAQADLTRLAGPLQALSKHHCRVFWSTPLDGAADVTLAAQWRVLDAPRSILDGRFISRPGVFAWDRIDVGSALLAAHLPATLAGHGADLGAGFGYLASEVLSRCPAVTALDVYEADARALALAHDNLDALNAPAAVTYHWHDVIAGLPQRYDFIVTNPPFHAHGGSDRPDLGCAFIAAAAQALQPGGTLLLVANRHLPYESVLDAQFGSARVLAQRAGFKVIEAIKAHALRAAR